MGKTFRRNDKWKKDRRDQSFKKSKKFKEIKNSGYQPAKSTELQLVVNVIENDDLTSI